MWLCTPPSETRPSRCSAPPPRKTLSAARFSTGFSKKSPSRTDFEMRVYSWYTMRPAPMFRCPTSELPICPSGRPTASPLAPIDVCEYSRNILSRFGFRAAAIALPRASSERPKPSSITSMVGLCLIVMFCSFFCRVVQAKAAKGPTLLMLLPSCSLRRNGPHPTVRRNHITSIPDFLPGRHGGFCPERRATGDCVVWDAAGGVPCDRCGNKIKF